MFFLSKAGYSSLNRVRPAVYFQHHLGWDLNVYVYICLLYVWICACFTAFAFVPMNIHLFLHELMQTQMLNECKHMCFHAYVFILIIECLYVCKYEHICTSSRLLHLSGLLCYLVKSWLLWLQLDLPIPSTCANLSSLYLSSTSHLQQP